MYAIRSYYVYLDSRGGIIAAVNPSQELDFPVITGLEKFQFNSVTSENIPEPLQDVYALLKLANRNNPILPEQNISEIHLAENGELVLYLLDKPFPIPWAPPVISTIEFFDATIDDYPSSHRITSYNVCYTKLLRLA